MKNNVTMSIDSDAYVQIKKLNINVSELVSNYLIEYTKNTDGEKSMHYVLLDGLKRRVSQLESEKRAAQREKKQSKFLPNGMRRVTITGGK